MANQKKSTPKLSDSVKSKLGQMTTTSAKIRYLTKEGYDRGDVARILGKRYQHVRNVLVTPLADKS